MNIQGTTSIDLSAVGGTKISCSCEVSYSALEQPEAITLRLANLDPPVIGKLLQPQGLGTLAGQKLAGVLSDGRAFEGVFALATDINLDSEGRFEVGGPLKGVWVATQPGAGQPVEGAWVFRLANLRFPFGDEPTYLPVPPDVEVPVPPQVLNKIRFSIGGREWTLTDDLVGPGRRSEDLEPSRPILSGTLTTPARPGDTWETVSSQADDIDYLLSLASSRGVRWVTQLRQDGTGKCLESRSRAIWVPPFGSGAPVHIDQWERGVIKCYLESCYPAYSEAREWFRRTLDMYLQAQVNSFIEIKAAILNTLVDRIQQYVNGTNLGPQIDGNLPRRIESRLFGRLLHRLLRFLSRNWGRERTNAVIQTIKDWNTRPSFPRGVELACARLQISAPAKKTLGRRHKLIHLGELDLRAEKAVEYWGDLDLLVLIMTLRRLGYDGIIHHHRIGHDPAPIGEILVETAGPPTSPAS